MATTEDNRDTQTNDPSPPTIKPSKSSQPKYRALHAYRYTTQILQTDVQFFEESLSEYRKKTKTNSNDRAKNILFNLPWLGKLQISETTGAITIYTDDPQAIDKLVKYIGEPLFKEIRKNLLLNSIGVHIPTTQIKLGQTIKTNQITPLGKATITTTLGIHKGYIDLHQHFKIPSPSPYPDEIVKEKGSEHRVSDAEILIFTIQNGQIIPNDYAYFGLRSKSLYPRLVRMEKKGLLHRLGGKGIVYIPTAPVNSIIDRNLWNAR